jgi:hypothetical protein
MTEDGKLNISDPIALLLLLFSGGEVLPCEAEGLEAPGNTALLDWQADGKVDLSDALGPLNYLFGTGPMHPLGVGCVAIVGCPELCVAGE